MQLNWLEVLIFLFLYFLDVNCFTVFIRVGKVEPNTKVEIKIEKGPVDLHCNEKVEELSVSDPGDKHDEFEVFLQGLEGTGTL